MKRCWVLFLRATRSFLSLPLPCHGAGGSLSNLPLIRMQQDMPAIHGTGDSHDKYSSAEQADQSRSDWIIYELAGRLMLKMLTGGSGRLSAERRSPEDILQLV